MTQYSLRNTYYGNFEYGKRDGHGTFLYANGSKYEGDWHSNLKHGYVFNKFIQNCFTRNNFVLNFRENTHIKMVMSMKAILKMIK